MPHIFALKANVGTACRASKFFDFAVLSSHEVFTAGFGAPSHEQISLERSLGKEPLILFEKLVFTLGFEDRLDLGLRHCPLAVKAEALYFVHFSTGYVVLHVSNDALRAKAVTTLELNCGGIGVGNRIIWLSDFVCVANLTVDNIFLFHLFFDR